MLNSTQVSDNSQSPKFWARLTKMKNGAFEMSVIKPLDIPEPRVVASIVKGADYNFSASADYAAPDWKTYPRKVQYMSPEQREQKDAENLRRSIRRAKQKVRELCKSMGADHMLTFSYRESMQDLNKLKADWKRFVRMMRGRHPKWQYVAIKERHDSEESQEEHRGGYHMHVAVKGKQDIKWILRCWYLAIGTDYDAVQQWYVHGVKLGSNSLGAVNVKSPIKRWGSKVTKWPTSRLAGYITKYLGKDFVKTEHHTMRYWHSKEIEKPEVIRFWLGATNFSDAIDEAYDYCFYKGAENFSFWQPDNWENIYITGDGLYKFEPAASVFES